MPLTVHKSHITVICFLTRLVKLQLKGLCSTVYRTIWQNQVSLSLSLSHIYVILHPRTWYFSLEDFFCMNYTYILIDCFYLLFLCLQGVDIRWNMPLISTVSQSRILTCRAWTWRPCTTAIIWVMCTRWTSATTIWAAAHCLSFTLFSVARFLEVVTLSSVHFNHSTRWMSAVSFLLRLLYPKERASPASAGRRLGDYKSHDWYGGKGNNNTWPLYELSYGSPFYRLSYPDSLISWFLLYLIMVYKLYGILVQ